MWTAAFKYIMHMQMNVNAKDCGVPHLSEMISLAHLKRKQPLTNIFRRFVSFLLLMWALAFDGRVTLLETNMAVVRPDIHVYMDRQHTHSDMHKY